MLLGHFKVGSHAEYSGAEGVGLLSDNSEGSGETVVSGDLHNFTGRVGSTILRGCTFTGPGQSRSIVVDETINSSIFCASSGNYNATRHEALINGTADYAANPETTGYLVLSKIKLRRALILATNEIFQTKTSWIIRPVDYAERVRSIPASEFTGISDLEIMHRTLGQAFTKPKHFEVEDEIRFLMVPMRGLQPPMSFFTSNLSTQVQDAFKAAIHDVGR